MTSPLGAAQRGASQQSPALWGILNVTPDSFSDGGRFDELDAAVAHAEQLVADGAAVIDVGGESTRPGAEPVPPQLEQQRVLPVVRALAQRGIPVSIDTMHASTAAAAVEAGAVIVNDVSGGLSDPAMFDTVAPLGIDYVVMHWRGSSEHWAERSSYAWAPREVVDEVGARLDAARAAGIADAHLWVDPGLGFAKQPEHNWQLLAHLAEWRSLGARLLVGASRKRFLGALLPDDAATDERDLMTATLGALIADDVDALRVHDVRSSARALAVQAALAVPRDAITLTGLRARAHHGVFEHERRDGQEFIIDVAARLDLRAAAAGDALDRTVHYGVLAEQVVAAVERDPVDLIETVAERVAAIVLHHPPVVEVEVTVHKPQAPITVPFDDVSVTIVRGRA